MRHADVGIPLALAKCGSRIGYLGLLPILALLTGCASIPIAPAGSNGWQKLGQVNDPGPRIIPLAVLEDTRCPVETECTTPGKIRVLTRFSLWEGEWVREEVLEIGQRISLSDGTVALVAVVPERIRGEKIATEEYRFAYRFDGGL